MTSEELASRYIQKTERVFEELKIARRVTYPDEGCINETVEAAKRYLEDAKYYLDRKRFETSLASIAYCEGLLDALRMLGFVEFSWEVKLEMETEKRRKIVLAEGTFDLLHYGHIYYLTNAKKAGGEDAKLVVVVASDKTVERMKGSRPVIPEDQRRVLVESLKVVDESILGYEDMDIGKVIEAVKPDVIALGYDKERMEETLRKHIAKNNLNIQVVRINKFEKDIDSSSKIKRRIIERYRGDFS